MPGPLLDYIPDEPTVLDELTHARAAAGLDVHQLGARLSPPVSGSTVSRWESGKVPITLRRVLEIRRVLLGR